MGMSDEEQLDRILKRMTDITKVDSRHDIVEDGLYKGCIIRYSSGFELYHPYVPMIPADNGEITHRDGTVQHFIDGYPVYADMMPSPSSARH